jgi:hypothetical protein
VNPTVQKPPTTDIQRMIDDRGVNCREIRLIEGAGPRRRG